jgi:hypothetical protein
VESDPYDRSGQWLIGHHGDSILRLAAVGPVASWRALKGELVQPKRIPDGLLEVRLQGEAESNLYLVELFARVTTRALEQMTKALMMVYLDREVLPEGVAVFLSRGDRQGVAPRHTLFSRRGWSRLESGWHSVDVWTLPAQELLALNDVGLTPWIPLTQFDGPPVPILEECRRRIDQQATPDEKPNLLAVSQVLMRLRYNDSGLFEIFGGEQAMIESPLIQELMAKKAHKDILLFLEGRFGFVPPDLAARLHTIADEGVLDNLVKGAGACSTLEEFRGMLPS